MRGMSKKPWLAFVGGVIFLCLVIDIVFIRYRRQLEQEFYYMAVEQMRTYTEAQKLEVAAYIDSVDNNLQAIRMLIESSDVELEGELLDQYLDRFNQENDFTISYITMEQLEKNLALPSSKPGDREVYERLVKGETVLSEIRYSNRLIGYFFGYAIPVKPQDGKAGVLRCIVDASKLMETKQIMTQNSLIASYIVEQNGRVGYSRVEDGKREAEIQSRIFDQRMDGQQARGQQARGQQETKPQTILADDYAGILQGENGTLMIGKAGGMMTFLSSAPLGHNDWYIVNISQASGLLEHTKIIMRNTIQSCLILIGITVIAGFIAYYVYSRQRKRISFESERYQYLSEFSDTVLLQYYYEDDTLELTANVRERFETEKLRKERYLEEQKPILDIADGDWQILRELLSNPGGEQDVRNTRIRIRDKQQNYVWCSLQIRFVYEKRKLVVAVGKITDISRHKELEERLVKQAQIDGLTGLYNKETAEKKIAQLLEEEQSGYLFMIDVDNFKEINDTQGHAKGDEVLIQIGAILREVFRKEDVVGRIGGDEFVAFVRGGDDRGFSAGDRAGRILKRLGQCEDEWKFAATVSIGIASSPRDGSTYEELYIAADRAMYLAKKKGKNQFDFPAN